MNLRVAEMRSTKSESDAYSYLINAIDGVVGDQLMRHDVSGHIWGAVLVGITDPLAEDRFDRLEDGVYNALYTSIEDYGH